MQSVTLQDLCTNLQEQYNSLKCEHQKTTNKLEEINMKYGLLRMYADELEISNNSLSSIIKKLKVEYSKQQSSLSAELSPQSLDSTIHTIAFDPFSHVKEKCDKIESQLTPTSASKPKDVEQDSYSVIDLTVIKSTDDITSSSPNNNSLTNTNFACKPLSTEHDYLYFKCQKRSTRSGVRKCLCRLGVNPSYILDVIFLMNTIVGILLHNNTRTEICDVLKSKSKFKILQDFNPLDPVYLKVPIHKHLSDEEKVKILFQAHKVRCIYALHLVPKSCFYSVLMSFMAKGWIAITDIKNIMGESSEVAQAASIVHVL
ncbi:MAG: hypothetical protein EXX96DRAFT_569874 [Benjaminiella poitrasii]|nr:MAG: hypothetical protein EXX96DRAFT_569874 [Benjaminiella poitrasii]